MKKKKVYKLAMYVLLVFAAIFASLLTWLYTGKMTQTKQKVFKALPLPIAVLGNKPIFMEDYLLRYQAAEKASGQKSDADKQALKFTHCDFRQQRFDRDRLSTFDRPGEHNAAHAALSQHADHLVIRYGLRIFPKLLTARIAHVG
jgi:hypothetical protein